MSDLEPSLTRELPEYEELARHCATLEQRLRTTDAILESMACGVAIYDAQSRLITSNAMYAALSCLPPALLKPGVTRFELQRHGLEAGLLEAADHRTRMIVSAEPGSPGRQWHPQLDPVRRLRRTQDGKIIEIVDRPGADGSTVVTLSDATYVQQTEQDADKKAMLVDTLLNNPRISITVFDAETRLSAFNRWMGQNDRRFETEANIGRRHADLLAELASSLDQNEDLDTKAVLERIANADLSKPFHYTRRARSGAWLDVYFDPTADGGFTVTHVDVTALQESRQAEAKLADIHRKMLHSMSQGIVIHGADMRLIAANPVAAELLGTPFEALKPGLHLCELVDVIYRHGGFGSGEAGLLAVREALATDRSKPSTLQLTTAEGRVLLSHSRPTDDGGYVVTFTDVTPLWLAKEGERDRSRVLQALIDAMPGMVIRKRKRTDGGWQLFFVSDAITTLTGYSVAEASVDDWAGGVIDPLDLPGVLEHSDRALADGQACVEFRLRRKDDRSIWVRSLMRGQIDSDGHTEVICIWNDITAERAMNVQMARAVRMAHMGDVATGMAHELNQPLASISLAAENAIRTLDGLPTSTPYLRSKLDVIVDQVQRAAGLIDHVKAFSRSEPQPTSCCRLHDVLAAAHTQLHGNLAFHGVVLDNRVPSTLSDVRGTKMLIERALTSILNNSCEAYARLGADGMNVGRVILVEGWEDESGVHMVLLDRAGGIPEDVLPTVFEPFFTTKAIGQGTGLGLWVAHSIVSQLGGIISARTVDDGAEFHIVLPRGETQEG